MREVVRSIGREVAIIAGLQGPRIHVGKFKNGRVTLEPGSRFMLDARCELGNQERVGLNYKELPRGVDPGDLLLLNSGLIVSQAERVVGEEIETVVKVDDDLSNDKGINCQGGGLSVPTLTAEDMEDIKITMVLGIGYIAIGFPKSATDMEMACQSATVAGAPYGHRIRTIAKIGRAGTIRPDIPEEILVAFDGVVVACGDLAVKMGNAAMPAL